MNKFLALITTGLLLGCSVESPSQQAGDEGATDCIWEERTGTRIPTPACRTQRAIERDRQAAREYFEEVQRRGAARSPRTP